MIYLDNAATTHPKPPEVLEAILNAMEQFGNCGRGAHPDALKAARTVYDTRIKAAALFGCPDPAHVAFASNVTEALNTAIFGLIGENDHVLSTDLEHNSVLRPLYALERGGTSLDFVPADGKGRLDYSAFHSLLKKNTRAVVCTHASNVTGDVTDIRFIGQFCREHGLIFILDTAQSAGTLPIDMQKDLIDVVCFTGHKGLMGPQGTGGLCFGDGIDIRPLKFGGTGVQSFLKDQPVEYPTRLEAGTLNTHGIAGLNAGLSFIERTGLGAIRDHEMALCARFLNRIKCLSNVTLYGDYSSKQRAAIVSLNIGDCDAADISDELSSRFGIATRPGAHCAPRIHHALGTKEQGIVRFSWSYFNTEEETDAAAEAVAILSKEALADAR